ncbi:tetratricopeptide repeat protein [Burkholderia multivorans]|uniref:tetratricopeptide repeat protein n=1 Tax=Burkholderia multivorans TaxID=87883 RepID=UPI0020188E54|nr:hypothetical protein [Burkholderia multivorans]MCL4650803.1 hypothetical protein [Burkholderia multivorans]MCL4655979.1 hypothetical protein [Burkholderia multivorans]MCO1425305.1 hypothetical protein [Burkholderia multivorans]UQN83642.1 hypothetical protein L0Z18_15205 [Burkholderia multivorans]UQO65451.1 hypothetical protein L0Z19_13415 [Burkholderia multivorans]
MNDSNDLLIPLLPPLTALLERAADAQSRGEHDARALWLAAAAHLHPVDSAALSQLTSALVARQRTGDAVALAACAARVHADAAAHFNYGYALQMAGRHADAVAPYRAALALDPDRPSLRNNLAIAVRLSGGDRAEEVALLEAAVHADPCDVQAWINLVVAQLAMRNLDRALVCAARLVELAPDNALAMNNVAMAMKEAQRWDGAGELRGRRPALPGPRWQGEPLKGKTLLLWGEQGLGDVLQFCRFVAPLAERVHREGGRLVWNTFPLLGTLLQRSLGAHADEFGAGGDIAALPAFDYEVPLIGLPLMLGIEHDTLASSVPYLRADARAIDAWRARLARERRLKVGLVWTGSAGHQRNPLRRVGIERYAHAFRGIDGVAFYSLQPGADADVAAARASGFAIEDCTSELKSFDDTAAFIGALDLVITVCTSVAHLAGALGARTWVLLDVNPHWPWLLERGDSPWYPTATLYRQRTFGDWQPVMDGVTRDLRGLAATLTAS